jgi:type VI secretion system secreted protein Hcp
LVLWSFWPSSTPSRPSLPTAAVAMQTAAASGDPIFFQYDAVTGPPSEISHAQHATGILSVQFGVSRSIGPASASGLRGESSSIVSNLCLTKLVDQYSVGFLTEHLKGPPRNAKLYFTKASFSPYGEFLRWELSNVLIASITYHSSGDRPSETICLNFTKLTVVVEQTGRPNQLVTWDFALNQTTVPTTTTTIEAASTTTAPASTTTTTCAPVGC